ncbi:nuclear factor 7, brain-like isoform X2 [Pseudophryne corroboree]|uniref:nuclear factor 7, brain-like isoform X2 n=1 Tax=Pseudophryne corroboree TaxID=495146 RepID=UPI003081684C
MPLAASAEKAKVKAENAPANNSAMASGDFAAELTCLLCNELFKDPVMVDCGHNFCRDCIDEAWEGQDSFTCPDCKDVITEKYTTNRAIANLVKKTVGAPTVVTPAKPVEKVKPAENCPEHNERLKLYCKDDGTRSCVICPYSLKHASHHFLPIQDAVEVHRDVITEKYTTNRAIANLVKKTVGAPTVVTLAKPVEKVKPAENCPLHYERLKLYCKDDETLSCVICRDSLIHASHNFLPILDAVDVYKTELSAIVAPLEEVLKVTEQLANQQSEKVKQHRTNVSDYKQHIVSEFEKLHSFLKQRKEKRLEQLNEQGDSLLKEMESNMVKMQKNRRIIKQTISMANERVNDKDSISFLTDIKAFMEKCQEQQREAISSRNSLLSKDLCQGTFKGPIQYTVWKQMKSYVVPYLSPVLLDPSTAHPHLLLSDGLTSVKYVDSSLHLPDNPKRFSHCFLVLGSEGFSSGRHYWEVDVGDKTAWDIGMASESCNRKGKIKLNPNNGYWAIWLRNGNVYKATEHSSKTLVLNAIPKKIGIYLDYEGGQISFYNADDMSAIYTFNATFTEKLYPYLSPFLHDSGRNAEALRLVHN